MDDIYTAKNIRLTPRSRVPGRKICIKSIFVRIFTFVDRGKNGHTMGKYFSHTPNDATKFSVFLKILIFIFVMFLNILIFSCLDVLKLFIFRFSNV